MKQLTIETVEDVKAFFLFLYKQQNIAFHPDEDFRDYIDIETKTQIFTLQEAMYLNEIMTLSFQACKKAGIDIYQVGSAMVYCTKNRCRLSSSLLNHYPNYN